MDRAKNLKELANFNPLISFLKQFFYEELQALPEERRQRLPFKQD